MIGSDPSEGPEQVTGLAKGDDLADLMAGVPVTVSDEGTVVRGTTPSPRREPWRPRRSRFVTDMILGGLLMVALHLFVLQISVVKGHSMEPSLWDGDRLVVDRLSYQVMEVCRGDVVVLRYPLNPDIDFVKRVVGVPGDRVRLVSGRLYVNGVAHATEYKTILDRENMAPLVVPEGHYFVLGDNRPISCDSREFGLVAQELLKGKVRARFWPLDRLSIF